MVASFWDPGSSGLGRDPVPLYSGMTTGKGVRTSLAVRICSVQPTPNTAVIPGSHCTTFRLAQPLEGVPVYTGTGSHQGATSRSAHNASVIPALSRCMPGRNRVEVQVAEFFAIPGQARNDNRLGCADLAGCAGLLGSANAHHAVIPGSRCTTLRLARPRKGVPVYTGTESHAAATSRSVPQGICHPGLDPGSRACPTC